MGSFPSKVKFKNSAHKPMEGTDRGREASSPSWNHLWRLESETWPGPWDRTRVPCKADSYPLYQQGRPRPSFESTVKDRMHHQLPLLAGEQEVVQGSHPDAQPPSVPTAPSPPRHPFLFVRLLLLSSPSPHRFLHPSGHELTELTGFFVPFILLSFHPVGMNTLYFVIF